MLSWLTNSPDLTDLVVADFWEWLRRRYDADGVEGRYPPEVFPSTDRPAAIRSPSEADAACLMHDLGHYMRDRFARYVAALRCFAEEAGMGGVPFVVNVHGTDNGSGAPFPIGISQLFASYTQAPGYLAGSDIYLGDLTFPRAADLYLINGFMAAVSRPEQPLASVEFECGEGDHEGTLAVRTDPSAADFKLRLCVAQGNRWLNLYLFAGGVNYRLDEPVGDGNDRIGFTGERHGINAPVGPEGQLNSTYPRLARTIRSLMAVGDKLAVAREERDGVTLGFIPDYYLTESVYPASQAMTALAANLTANRGGGPRGVLARAMLAACYRFGCLDVQNQPLNPDATPVLALASARFMDGAVQTKLADYLAAGGRLLLAGEIPRFDLDASPCTILADRLGLRHAGEWHASSQYHLSVTADGWAAPRAEMRADFAQLFEPGTSDVILRVYGSDHACGFDLSVGDGRAIVFAAAIPCDVALFRTALERLGASPALAHGYPHDGIVLTSAATPSGERFVHLINLDGFDKPVRLTDGGRDLLPGRELLLRARDALMLPFGVTIGDVTIVDSTAEIAAVEIDAIAFRLTQAADTITLETDRDIAPGDAYDVERQGRRWSVRSRRPACGPPGGDLMSVRPV
jgi:beta-galactosidase